MKKGIRVLGIDDASFEFDEEETFLTGVVYRGTEFIEDIQSVEIEVDGDNATEKVVQLFEKCQNTTQIKAVLVDGVSFAGFNIVDIEKVSGDIGKPVIAVTSNEPDKDRFREAMKHSGNYDKKFEELAPHREIELKDGKCYVQFSGCSFQEAEEVVKSSTIHGLVPEPIRVAHMIGRALPR